MTKTYYKFDENGKFISALHLDEDEAELQGGVTLDSPSAPQGQWPWRVNGAWQYHPLEIQKKTTSELRRSEYPPIEEQLDMLWHAMDRGEIPVAPGFYGVVKQVKDKYPKLSQEPTPFVVGPMPEA